MFEFFEKIATGIGFKLVDNFAAKLSDFISEVIKDSKGKENDNEKDDANIGSNGRWANIGSNGDDAKIGSNGRWANIGSNGGWANIGSNGYGTNIGSNGRWANIGSNGDNAKIGSNGDDAHIEVNGENTIAFATGRNSIIKAKKGTWIALSEFEWNEEKERYIPIFAKTAQIGNKEYKDFKGRTLKETEYYILHNKEFYPVDNSDGIEIIKISEKVRDGIMIIKGQRINDDFKECYLVKENELNAHGNTLKQALEDLQYKKLENAKIDEIVSEIKKNR